VFFISVASALCVWQSTILNKILHFNLSAKPASAVTTIEQLRFPLFLYGC